MKSSPETGHRAVLLDAVVAVKIVDVLEEWFGLASVMSLHTKDSNYARRQNHR